MAEDVDLLKGYDEDLCENPFFRALQTKFKQLYDEAANNRWTICIPRQGTLPRASHTLTNIETHILKTTEEKESAFTTVNGKEVQVSGEFILTTEGFQDVKSVQILFEETFFNHNNESYVVLCVDQPLEGGLGVSAEPVVVSLETLQACSEFLWSSSGNKQTQRQIDEIVKLFNNQYQQLEGESLRHLMDAANAIYTRAMQAALKNWYLRRLTRTSRKCMDNVKLAIETYIMKGLHGALFKAISSITGHEDAALNKTTRNLADVQIKDLGIRTELCSNLPKGRRILSSLNKFKTPLEKFHCLKKAVIIIMDRKMKEGDGASNAVTADDLLPALVFLVIKADVPNWLANITFLHNFHFSKCGYSEFQFYLSTIEAAVEHVRGGFVDDISKGVAPAKRFVSPWQQVESDSMKSAALERLFEFAATGDEAKVEALLDSANDVTSKEKLCHPLCSCDKCDKLQSSKRNDPSAVTVFSRDDMGRTVLHVTAEYGCSNLAYKLIKRGAVVNTMDYHGTTPLHLACQKGHSSVVLILMHYKADVNAPDNDGNTPLHLCTANGHDQCAKALVYYDMQFNLIKVDAANEHGDRPLHLASRWGYAELVQLLLEKGASIEAKNKNKETPLVCSHSRQVSELLLDAAVRNLELEPEFPFLPRRSASVSERDTGRSRATEETPQQDRHKEIDVFLRTIADGDIEMVRFKLGFTDDEDEEDSGETLQSEQDLCHPLCQCNKCSKWQKLSRQAADKLIHANVVNEDSITPLHVAAVRGYEEMTSLLLRRGAKPNQKNISRRQTPLHLACQYNHPMIVGQLINYQAKLNVKDYKSNTPLHFCCINGHLEPARVLIKGGANVNIANDRGNTPLHEAARWNFVPLVRILVEHGASVTLRNNMHLTPVQYAQHDDVVRVLAQTEIKTEEDQTPDRTTEKSSSALAQLERQLSSSPSKLQAMDVTSERFKISYEVHPKYVAESRLPATEPGSAEFGAESLSPSRLKLNKIFEQLETGRMEKLQQITTSVRAFDRRKSLKRTDTLDKSLPLLDVHLLHQLSIQHFDSSFLRKTKTRDKSRPMIDVDVDYDGDVSDEESGTRHQEKDSDVHSQTGHVDRADVSDDSTGTRRELDGCHVDETYVRGEESGTRWEVNQERSELDGCHVGKLREISKAVRDFDRRSSLRRIDTVDKSSPLLDLQLRHQLSIQHFDSSFLRKTKTRDKSRPMIDVDVDYDGDVSDEESGTRHQEKDSDVHSQTGHVDRADVSDDSTGTRRELDGCHVDETYVRGEESGTRWEVNQERSELDGCHVDETHVRGEEPGTRREVNQDNFRFEPEGGHVGKLREISQAVRDFDRRSSLRKIDTVDKSSPLLDLQLRHQLNIEHFDTSVLRKTTTQDRSRPIIDLDDDGDGDVGDEGSLTSEQLQTDDVTRSEVT